MKWFDLKSSGPPFTLIDSNIGLVATTTMKSSRSTRETVEIRSGGDMLWNCVLFFERIGDSELVMQAQLELEKFRR